MPVTMTRILSCLERTDWRSLLLVLTALTGAMGFAWNKVELYVQQYRAAEIEQVARNTDAAAGGAYEALATRIDELFVKVESLEKKARIQTHYVPITTDSPPVEEPITIADEVREVIAEAKPKLVSDRYPSARLPEFKQVQQAAQNDLGQFIDNVKLK